ncbi:MAG TPA: hypothetical protein VLR71_21970 [Casimicrobiaceae bacterium]|nr:hypothetical protein [Casimicrobiaceae bacterium]
MNARRTIFAMAAYVVVTAVCVCLLQIVSGWLMDQAGSEGRAVLIQANTWVQTVDEHAEASGHETGGSR